MYYVDIVESEDACLVVKNVVQTSAQNHAHLLDGVCCLKLLWVIFARSCEITNQFVFGIYICFKTQFYTFTEWSLTVKYYFAIQ